MRTIVIIGNGIAGSTAARMIRKYSSDRIIMISKESTHFFSRPALMYVFMGHMKFGHLYPYENHFWANNNIDLVHDEVTRIETENKKILLAHADPISFDILILATGSSTRYYNWQGQNLDGVQGFVSKQDLELLELNCSQIKHPVIIGGGLIGIELAEMFCARGIIPTLLVRGKHVWDNVLPVNNAQLLDEHIKQHGVDLRLSSELDSILGTKKVQGIRLSNHNQMDCDYVCIATGVSPSISLAKNSSIHTNRGILVNEYLETSIPSIYAIGDCAELQHPSEGRQAIEAVWYTGRMMGETLAKTICYQQTAYQPGFWFNSAKFFDIEYQTYGTVSAKPNDEEAHIHWYSKKNTRQMITIAYHRQSKIFKGINTFDCRMRHHFFDHALRNNHLVSTVIEQLHNAHFQPEFFTDNWDKIKKELNLQLCM